MLFQDGHQERFSLKNEYTKRQYLIELILSICFCRNCTDYTGLYIFRQLQFWKLDLKKYIGYDLSCCFWFRDCFFAFHYALTKITPIQLSILAYINTIIAIFLGWLLLDEEISIKFIIAAFLIICGVFITNYKPKSERRLT